MPTIMQARKSPYGRIAFPNLLEVDDNGKYSTALFLPRTEKPFAGLVAKGLPENHVKKIIADVEQFKDEVIADLKEASKHKRFDHASLFKDGKEKVEAAIEAFKAEKPDSEIPSYCYNAQDCWVINVKSQFVPKFYGPKASEGELGSEWAKGEIYGGVWARLDVMAYDWIYQGKKGTSLGLGGTVQKWTDDSNWDATTGGGGDSEMDDALEFKPEAAADDFLS